jgi:hypothetical protein
MFTYEINVICDKCGAMEAIGPLEAEASSLQAKGIIFANSIGWNVEARPSLGRMLAHIRALCPDCAKLCQPK